MIFSNKFFIWHYFEKRGSKNLTLQITKYILSTSLVYSLIGLHMITIIIAFIIKTVKIIKNGTLMMKKII